MPTLTPELQRKCIDTIRFLAVDAVENANSGHPGLPMGAAPMAFVLWTRHLRFNPNDPRWAGRFGIAKKAQPQRPFSREERP